MKKWTSKKRTTKNPAVKESTIVKPFLIRALPEVAIRVLLCHMTPSAIFLLSRSSEKTKQILKRNMFRARDVSIKFETIDNRQNTMFMIRVSDAYDCALKVQEDHLAKKKSVIEILDSKIKLKYEFSEDAVVFKIREFDTIEFKLIYSMFCDCFNYDSTQIFVFFTSNLWFIPRNLESGIVKRCKMSHESGRHPDVQNFFRNQSNMELLIVEARMTSLNLNDDSVLLKTPSIIHRNIQQCAGLYMLWFRGKHGLLENAHLQEFYSNAFLKLWSQGKKENLESLIVIQRNGRRFDSSGVLELLEKKKLDPNGSFSGGSKVEKWDPRKRNRFYPYQSIISDHHNFAPNTFDCQHGYDVVRDSDGKRATIKVSSQHFMFFVWP